MFYIIDSQVFLVFLAYKSAYFAHLYIYVRLSLAVCDAQPGLYPLRFTYAF